MDNINTKLTLINSNINIIYNIFNEAGFEIRLIGGCIRNILLDEDVKDFDFATNALPQDIIRVLKNNNYLAIPTGIKHGTITAKIDNDLFEITTLRKDIKCNGRKAIVEFTDSFREDAGRRDFTINALSLDQNSNLYDYHDGLNDLQKKTIKFINDPQTRVQEDYLRILRFYRFLAYYGGDYDIETRNACRLNRDFLTRLSGERVWDEISKILVSPNLINIIPLMIEDKIFLALFNLEKVNFEWLKRIFIFEKKHNIKSSAIRNLFALVSLEKKDLSFLIKEKKLKSYLNMNLINVHLEDHDSINYYLYKLGKDIFIEQIILYLTFYNENITTKKFKELKTISVPVFPLKGRDIMYHKNIKGGPVIGQKLKKLEEIWVKSNFNLNKNQLLQRI